MSRIQGIRARYGPRTTSTRTRRKNTFRSPPTNTPALKGRFLAKPPRLARILDAGCVSGRDLRASKRAGHVALGIDSSVASTSLACVYCGAECMVLRLDHIAFERSFNGIWACASLLYQPRAQPVPVVMRLHQALVFGRTLYLADQEGQGERCIEDWPTLCVLPPPRGFELPGSGWLRGQRIMADNELPPSLMARRTGSTSLPSPVDDEPG